MTDGTAAIGTIHFALMALLAVLVVIGILWGVRAKRRRLQGQREFEAHAEEAGIEIPPPPAAERIAPAVVPSPAPPADRAAVATPRPEHLPASPPADASPQAIPLAHAPIPAAIAPHATSTTPALDEATDTASPTFVDGPLTQLKGLGPKVAARMAELGVERVGQLAALDDAGVRDLDAQLGPFTGRMARDRWVEQARLLAAGDRDGFERAFGKLG
jgi:predicted flap endonuclease-1-like 5' DNA nuclease